MRLLEKIIASYDSGRGYRGDSPMVRRGIPLGNLTSQLFINVYLDHLDKYAKEDLKIKKYVRYADDFLVVSKSHGECKCFSARIRTFLWQKLNLNFPTSHERIVKLSQGVEVLGIKFLPTHQKVRPSTRRRMMNIFRGLCQEFIEGKISAVSLNASWQSLRGLLFFGQHGKLKNKLLSVVNNII